MKQIQKIHKLNKQKKSTKIFETHIKQIQKKLKDEIQQLKTE